VDEKEQKQLLMDLDVVMRSNDCQFIVKFYGALFKEVGFRNSLVSVGSSVNNQSDMLYSKITQLHLIECFHRIVK